jgi:hypothetical protein
VVEAQGYGVALFPIREVRRQTPRAIVIDPVTRIPHKSIEFHLSERVAKVLGSYSTTINYPTIEHLLARFLTNWMGDEGWLKRTYCEYRKFVYHSDVVWLKGTVTEKYIDDNNDCCVKIETCAINQRNENVMPGNAVVILPSKTRNTFPVENRLYGRKEKP